MSNQTPSNQTPKEKQEDVNEALDESFPASDPPAYTTPQPEHQEANMQADKITTTTWVAVALVAVLTLWLISLAF